MNKNDNKNIRSYQENPNRLGGNFVQPPPAPLTPPKSPYLNQEKRIFSGQYPQAPLFSNNINNHNNNIGIISKGNRSNGSNFSNRNRKRPLTGEIESPPPAKRHKTLQPKLFLRGGFSLVLKIVYLKKACCRFCGISHQLIRNNSQCSCQKKHDSLFEGKLKFYSSIASERKKIGIYYPSPHENFEIHRRKDQRTGEHNICTFCYDLYNINNSDPKKTSPKFFADYENLKRIVQEKNETCSSLFEEINSYRNVQKNLKNDYESKLINIKKKHDQLFALHSLLKDSVVNYEKNESSLKNRISFLSKNNKFLNSRILSLEDQKKKSDEFLRTLETENQKLNCRIKNFQILKVQYENTMKNYFDRVPDSKRENIIRYVANEIFNETKEVISKYSTKRKNTRSYCNFNILDLANFSPKEEWNRYRNSILGRIIDSVIDIKNKKIKKRSTNYYRKQSGLKITLQTVVEKIVNHRAISPYRIILSFLIHTKSSSSAVVRILESCGVCCSPSVLKDFFMNEYFKSIRKENVLFRDVRKKGLSDLCFTFRLADNNQSIPHHTRKTKWTRKFFDNIELIYFNNVEVSTSVPYLSIHEAWGKMSKTEDLDHEIIFKVHREEDLKHRDSLLKELFVSIESEWRKHNEYFCRVCCEEDDDIIEVYMNQYFKTLKKECENCGEVCEYSSSKVCSECGESLTIFKDEKAKLVDLESSMKDIFENNEFDDFELFDINMKNLNTPGIREQKMKVKKGMIGNPSRIEDVKKYLKFLEKELKKSGRSRTFLGLDGAPASIIVDLILQNPDLFDWVISRTCLLHSKMNHQKIIMSLIRRLCPIVLDIAGWTSSKSKDFICNNGDNHKTRDFILVFFKSLSIEMLTTIEDYFNCKVKTGDEFIQKIQELKQTKEYPMGILMYDIISRFVFLHISNRRGNSKQTNRALRVCCPLFLSKSCLKYQKLMIYDQCNRARMKSHDMITAYDNLLIYPTKCQVEGHEFDEMGSTFENTNKLGQELLPKRRPPTEIEWDESTQLFESKSEIMENAKSMFGVARTGYLSGTKYQIDVIGIAAGIRMSKFFEISHFSTKDSNGAAKTFHVDEYFHVLNNRLEIATKEFLKATKERRKMVQGKKYCGPVIFDGEHEDDGDFIFDGEENEDAYDDVNDEIESDTKYHDLIGKEDMLGNNAGEKAVSKFIEHGWSVKCCNTANCELHLNEVFGISRCEHCNGYAREGICLDLCYEDGDKNKVYYSICHTCRDRKKCSNQNCCEKFTSSNLDRCLICLKYFCVDCVCVRETPRGKVACCEGCQRRFKKRRIMRDEN